MSFPIRGGSSGHGDAAIDSAGQNEATVEVRVLADQVHAARSARDELRCFAEPLSKSASCLLLNLPQEILLTPRRNPAGASASTPRRRRSWPPGTVSPASIRARLVSCRSTRPAPADPRPFAGTRWPLSS